jgi:enamine deaminase RidA (YjgF/YER057c/UK114 family)
MSFEDNLKKLNITLPDAKAPAGNYVATKVIGKLLYISGQISINEKGELIKGKVGKDLDTDMAYQAAKRCGLSIITQAKNACNGDLSKIKSCVKLTGFVNSTDEFIEQPKVINGASDLMASIFGEAGMHTRAAVSTNSLPLGVAVEIDAIFELN